MQAVKKLARERKTTARAIVQQALARELSDQESKAGFVLTDASATGWASLRPEYRGVSLHELVLQSYDERS